MESQEFIKMKKLTELMGFSAIQHSTYHYRAGVYDFWTNGTWINRNSNKIRGKGYESFHKAFTNSYEVLL